MTTHVEFYSVVKCEENESLHNYLPEYSVLTRM